MQTPDNNLKKGETCNLQEKNDTGKSDFRRHEAQQNNFFRYRGIQLLRLHLGGRGTFKMRPQENRERGGCHIYANVHM